MQRQMGLKTPTGRCHLTKPASRTADTHARAARVPGGISPPCVLCGSSMERPLRLAERWALGGSHSPKRQQREGAPSRPGTPGPDLGSRRLQGLNGNRTRLQSQGQDEAGSQLTLGKEAGWGPSVRGSGPERQLEIQVQLPPLPPLSTS